MKERRTLQRLPLSFLCEIGRLNKKNNQWGFSEELVCNIDGSGLLLETKEDLAVDESIKLNLHKRSWHRYREGFVKLSCVLGFDDLYIKAKVVRVCNSGVNGIRKFGIKFENILFKWKYYISKETVNERQEGRRKSERRITEKGILELIESAVKLGLKNVICRSGTYYPSSTRNSTKNERRLFDRRILLPVRVSGIV